MKQLFILLLAAAALVACEKDDNKGNGLLDPNAKISLRPAAGVKAGEENPNHLSALEIVKQTSAISFYNYDLNPTEPVGRGFVEHQRDLVNKRLLMYGTDIVASDGQLVTAFLHAEDIVFIRADRTADKIIDTVAYIPNSVIHSAKQAITEAYNAGDYATCYKLFDEAFTFIPITGGEWSDLRAKGEN